MSVNRTQLVLGPGHLLWGGATTGSGDTIAWTPLHTLFCKKIDAKVVTKWNNIEPAGWGRIDRRKGDEMVTLHISSAGGLTAAVMALLWPYGATTMGTSIFGASDTPIGVATMAGQQLVLWCAAITKMPDIMLGANGMVYSDFEVTGIIRNSTDRANSKALYTLSAVAFSAQTENKPTIADFVTLPTVATWGTTAPEVIQAKSGWHISFEMPLSWQVSADYGTFDARFDKMEVRAKCLPIGFAESRWADLYIQGTGGAIGSSGRVQADLTLVQGTAAAGGITVVLKNASFDDANMQFGENMDRIQELAMIARRDISSGYGSLFTLAAT